MQESEKQACNNSLQNPFGFSYILLFMLWQYTY